MDLITPYYLIDERKLLRNLKKIKDVKEVTGARFLLALKCFSAWSMFGLMRKYLDGTTSSSLYEARLGHEQFGNETHAYCVGFTDEDIASVKHYADKVIFNSVSQLKRFHRKVHPLPIGLRVNPCISYSHFDIADPARRYSRLGVVDKEALMESLSFISGVMFHFNCENDDFNNLSASLDHIGRVYGDLLRQLEWISIGGGISFTKSGYPLSRFCTKLKAFRKQFDIQIYLEPGESVIAQAAELVTTVVDIVHNEVDIAIVDASTEAHMPDLLIYRTSANIERAHSGAYSCMVAGRSCLAGDVFGTYQFRSRLKVGQTIHIGDAAGYSMVKKNWFNGLQMPAIAVRRIDGTVDVVRRFEYGDYLNSLS